MIDNEAQWLRFHRKNPEIYRLFRKFALQAMDAKFTQYSARAIVDRIRWHVEIETRGSHYKIANSSIAYYARMFMMESSRYEGFFRTRDMFKEPEPALLYSLVAKDMGERRVSI